MFGRLTRIDLYGVFAMLLLAGAAWQFGVAPLLQARSVERNRMAKIVSLETMLAEEQATAAAVRSELEALSASLGEGTDVAGQVKSFNEQLGELTAMADVQAVKIEAIERGEAQIVDNWSERPIALNASATPAALTRFLAELRRKAPEAEVRTFRVVVREVEEASPVLTVAMALVYRSPVPSSGQ